MLALLGAIPGIGRIVEAVTSSWFNAKVRITQAKIGGDRDVATSIVSLSATESEEGRARLGIIASNKILTLLVVAFAAPFVIFIWKVVVWDIVFGLGVTDPIKGQVAEWADTIILAIFGAPTAMAIGKMWFANRSKG